MEEKRHPSPADVAEAFVKQYYVILHKSPENLHKFYQESSLQGWPGANGVVTSVTTLSGINKKVMASDYKYCSAEVKTTDAQKSLEGGIVVSVTGFLTRKDDVKYHFSQTFFLAKQEKGFFVLNDILRFFDVCESITEAADDENHTQNSTSSEACEGPSPLNFKVAVQSGKVEEASNLSVSVKTSANEKSSEKETKEKVQSVVKPATDVKIPSVVTPVVNVTPKITYASVLAKETTTVSPRVAAVVTKEAMSPKTRVSSSPRGGDVSPKAPALSSKFSPKSPKGGQALPNTGVNSEAKGVYIGGLPYDITKQGIVEVVKQFGPVRRHTDTIQIRRHEDGFCCGFVEFESADSAWRAVQAHHVMFGEKEAYILYKRPPYNRGNNSRARSPTRRGPNPNPNPNAGVTERDDWVHYSQKPRQASRDRLK